MRINMEYSVEPYKHYFKPFAFGLYVKKHFKWTVCFDESCRYDLKDDDQYDINKLVGVGYLWHHHNNSARFGWNYNLSTGKINLWAYCYDKKKRAWESLGEVEIGKSCRLILQVNKEEYLFQVIENNTEEPVGFARIPKTHNQFLGYRLGTYFGGNKTAPHEMSVFLQRNK